MKILAFGGNNIKEIDRQLQYLEVPGNYTLYCLDVAKHVSSWRICIADRLNLQCIQIVT